MDEPKDDYDACQFKRDMSEAPRHVVPEQAEKPQGQE